MPVTYEQAGVSVEAGYEAVRRMKAYAEATFDSNVLQSLGSFGGMYALGEQVLVSGTDGVGTKLKAAFALDRHDTVGIDCVAMCANDVVCHGARPLFFLDYIATGKLVPETAASIVKGVADGCRQAGCALIGGETAEMPGFYPAGEYDLAGFCVGIVDKAKLIDNSRVRAGDTILALASSGVHSNGFSLVRTLIPMEKTKLEEYSAELGKTLGEALLAPTMIYVKPILALIDAVEVHSIAHITGGGFTGATDPRTPYGETLPGKLPQRKIVTTAAAGYSSYGNQIGLATGLVDEIYHEGFVAKRMEIGAVVGAAPAQNVRRETPEAGDIVLLLGGKTGRDGCGGATGSSKAHSSDSLSSCGAEVQKGNAPEERKLQRLFRNPEASLLIKRCNDFGAGGVSVAIGELADGVAVDLDRVPVKYEGLNGTELAISESQERMAVVVSPADEAAFLALAEAENLQATRVAVITAEPRLTMTWQGERIVDLKRSLLDSNGAQKHMSVRVAAPNTKEHNADESSFAACYHALVSGLNVCSRRGLGERFDSTVGAYSVLLPFGGARQSTPAQAMAAKLPLLHGETNACTWMAWGYDPLLSEDSPYAGGYAAVVASLAKLAATGAPQKERYLSFQEYFGKPGLDPVRWGKPAAALLGALQAQLDYGVAAIGGKDSMSGSFESLDVPPTLVSFALGVGTTDTVLSPEFKRAGSRAVLLAPKMRTDGLPEAESMRALLSQVYTLIASKCVRAAYALGRGGIVEAVFKMCLGNGLGFRFAEHILQEELFKPRLGAFVVELSGGDAIGTPLGETLGTSVITWHGEEIDLAQLEESYDQTLEEVFPTHTKQEKIAQEIPVLHEYSCTKHGVGALGKPRILIPVFPGTNCEYESARAVERAGAIADVLVLQTASADAIGESLRAFEQKINRSQALFLPGGFSNGDEPDGSGKFITAFLRNPIAGDALMRLIDARGGLVLGICNGFQALIKLGLVPYGKIMEPSAELPTLTFNRIGRHQSRIVRTRVTSDRSPWLLLAGGGNVYSMPVSHGEGRFLCGEALLGDLAQRGQIAAQYVDEGGNPTMDVRFNPNGSLAAVEAITSPDGRILGKMGHSERIGAGLYQNVPGDYDMHLFESAVLYFS